VSDVVRSTARAEIDHVESGVAPDLCRFSVAETANLAAEFRRE